jgi:hypothetical protein
LSPKEIFLIEAGSMKSKSWLIIVMEAFGEVRHFRVERRTRVIFGLGAIVFVFSLAYFGYGYFTLFSERQDLRRKVAFLQERASSLDQKLRRIPIDKLPGFTPVKIDDFQVIRTTKRGGVFIRFRILNTHPLDELFRGTIVMIAKNESLKPPLYLVKPEMEFKKGVPANPEKGIRFEVKDQKIVEALFEGEGATFKAVTIFIYSLERKLIVQKTMELSEK